jgi:bifunctional non-homologous end joining protein LigD
MGKKDSLKEYRARRDFSRSPEPSGGGQKKRRKEPIFVIQKHDGREGALAADEDERRRGRRPA